MDYRISYEKWNNPLSIPACVVDEFLPDCDSVKLKVLLLILRDQNTPIDPEGLAQSLTLPTGDVRDALNFWVRKGLLKTEGALAQEPAGREIFQEVREKIIEKITPTPKPSPARLTANEIHNITQRQPLIRSLLHETEAILGKTLTSTDISTVISLYDWAGIPADVILMVVAHCASRDKRSLRYIEKTAMNWQEMGLDTVEAVENYLNEQSVIRQREREVQSAFGIYDRKLTAKEKDAIAQWYGEYGFDISLIRLAYEKTVDNTGKVSFPYIAKILSAWNQKGIRTPAQALAENSAAPQKAESSKKEYSFDLESFQQHQWSIPHNEQEG